MRNELTAPSLVELTSGDAIPNRIAIQLAKQLVDSELGPILSLTSPGPGSGESGRYHRFVTRLQRTAPISDIGYPDVETFSGAGSSKQTAKLRALGEAIERYCISLNKYDDYLTGQASELNHQTLSPSKLLAFSDTQLVDKPFTREDVRDASYHWTATTRLTDGETVFAPGQLVRLPFDSDLIVRQPTSHGSAAGTDYPSALYRALCELVERECFAIAYLNQLPAPEVNLMSVPSNRCREMATELIRMGWELTALDLSLDHPFQTCLVIGISEDNEKPVLNLGLNAADGIIHAIEGALREVFQFATQDPAEPTAALLDNPEATVRTLEDRKAFWNRQEMVDALDFWLSSPRKYDATSLNPSKRPEPAQSINRFQTFLRERNIEAYISDATTIDVRNHGFRVISVAIPEFHPLHLDEQFRYLGTERLYQVPVRTEYLEFPKSEGELNDIPHPFL